MDRQFYVLCRRRLLAVAVRADETLGCGIGKDVAQ
jgi:hypothetical protein